MKKDMKLIEFLRGGIYNIYSREITETKVYLNGHNLNQHNAGLTQHSRHLKVEE